MGRVRPKAESARRALATLLEALPALRGSDDLRRDGALQRFEYTFESVWKLARAVGIETLDEPIPGPRQAIRASVKAGWLSEDEADAAMGMLEDRNQTVHLYKETLMDEIAARLPDHAQVLEAWLARLEAAAEDVEE